MESVSIEQLSRPEQTLKRVVNALCNQGWRTDTRTQDPYQPDETK